MPTLGSKCFCWLNFVGPFSGGSFHLSLRDGKLSEDDVQRLLSVFKTSGIKILRAGSESRNESAEMLKPKALKLIPGLVPLDCRGHT